MRLSMWTYPWDLLDLSVEKVATELSHVAKLNTVSMATSYHAGRFLQPRSPSRKAYFPEDGTIYFRPNLERWKGLAIQPQISTVLDDGDALADLIRRRDEGGLAVSCWTVCLHNTRLGMLHPEAVTRNAFGDPNYYSLCPSNMDARAYVVTLVEDLTHSYRPDIVELESPSFMGFAHEFHHEKDGVGALPEDDFLLSLCFCSACMANARAAGIDADGVRATVKAWIVEMSEREVPKARWPDFLERGFEVFRAWPDVHEYVRLRYDVVTSLVRDIKERAHAESKINVIDFKDGWLAGSDMAAIAKVCDGIILCTYQMGAADVEAVLRAAREAIGPDRYLGAGFRLFYPEMPSGDELVARSQAAVRGGAVGINYYNYGLIPERRLAWIGRAVDALPSSLPT